ncbi:MAG: DNA translocase FtsK 4TM domain-containing protein [Proteobacteria bacterium]|nr:DNA translocase FtsK 4TM domain-containing protein [Pseudomonadota bacterium]
MPEKKKTQKTETKKRKQQPVSKRKQETTIARAKGSLEKSTAKNVKFDAPRLHVPNPRRIQRQSKLYAIFIAVLFIVLGVILFLMLFTFSSSDLAKDAETSVNLFGVIGSYIANVMLTVFGAASFIFSAVCLLMGIRTACGRQFEVTPAEIVGVCILIFGAAPMLAWGFEGDQIFEHDPGGALGTWAAQFGLSHMPGAAFFAVCLVLIIFGGLLVTDTKLKNFFLGIWRAIRWCFKTLGSALAEPFKKSKDESLITESAPETLPDESINESIFYEDSPSQLLNEVSSDLEERQAQSLKEQQISQIEEDSQDSQTDQDSEAEEDSPSTDLVDESDDELASVFSASENKEEQAKEEAEEIEAEEKQTAEPPKAERTKEGTPEALGDIMAKIRKSSPKPRSIKRSKSVPALEPDFEFDSIVAPEQIGTTRMTETSHSGKTSVLGNWRPRSIVRSSVKSEQNHHANPASERPTIALDDTYVGPKDPVPAPEIPPNMTKELLAQLATEDLDISVAKPASTVTRIASAESSIQKFKDAFASTKELENVPPSVDKKEPEPAIRGKEKEAVTAPAPAQNNIHLPVENENKTIIPASSEIRALLNASEEQDSNHHKNDYSNLSLDDDGVDEEIDDIIQDQAPNIKKNNITPKNSFVVAAEKKRISEDEIDRANKERLKNLEQAAYQFPPLSLLHYDPATQKGFDHDALQHYADKIVEKLAEYHIQGEVVQICPGPIITRFEFKPAPGTKVAKIASLSDDLMMALEIVSIRILAPIPGKGVVGIEIPNENRNMIYLKEIIGSPQFTKSKSLLTIALGKDSEGEPVVSDLAKMPHLLVAGSTGSGKSVAINTMICSLLFNASPDDVKLILVDPKMLELSIYEGIPHLLVPPITTPNETAAALDWACEEMDERYRKLASFGVRNIAGYNEQLKNPTLPSAIACTQEVDENGQPKYQHMPYIVIVVDEFADLMMTAGKEIEKSIARLAQKARAAGIHIILATQRPSTNVITGVIKANFPTRIAFRVFSYVDSRTILDQQGAENLLGMGDSLFLPPNTGILQRVHGAFVSDEEVQKVVQFLANQRQPEYNLDITTPKDEVVDEADCASSGGSSDLDPLFDQAVQLVAETRQASASFLQRRLGIGFPRAGRLIEQLEREGIVGPQKGQKPREVLIQPI